jgi:hypothetical protein
MERLTRGPIILLAAGTAGFLVWVATQINAGTNGGYWAVYAIIAGAGIVLAASQLTGGRPALSPSVLLFAFIPALIVVGWIVVAGQPHRSTTSSNVLAWSNDLGIRGIVSDLAEYVGVLAFGLGTVLGFSFVSSGPRTVPAPAAEVRDWREQPTVRPAEPVDEGAVREPEAVGASNGSSEPTP